MRLAISEEHWNCVAHVRHDGSLEYHDTWDGIIIVAPISGITQHYGQVAYICHYKQQSLWQRVWLAACTIHSRMQV